MENFRDAELKKWLAEEYEKETEEMEKILFPDGVIPDDGETEEEAKAAYQRLVEKLKADGVYKEDETDSIKTDDHKENVKIVYLPEKKSHKTARVAAAVLVCSAGIFAASMTSQANRSYFIDSVRYWAGDDTSKLNLTTIPQFMYRPVGLKFKSYEINTDIGNALIEYDYKNVIITLYINDHSDSSKNSDYNLDGETLETLKWKDENIVIEIKKIKDNQDKKENYVAYWKDNTAFYEISGKMEKEEFLKMIKNIRF